MNEEKLIEILNMFELKFQSIGRALQAVAEGMGLTLDAVDSNTNAILLLTDMVQNIFTTLNLMLFWDLVNTIAISVIAGILFYKRVKNNDTRR